MTARTFTQSDFKRVLSGKTPLEQWRAERTLDNPLGEFNIELNTTPDEESLRKVNELVAFVSDQYDAIIDVVYEDYRRASEDKCWMRGCEVPRRLSEMRVIRYVQSRSISVSRDKNGHVSGYISLSPQWDTEHGIHLRLDDGQLIEAF